MYTNTHTNICVFKCIRFYTSFLLNAMGKEPNSLPANEILQARRSSHWRERWTNCCLSWGLVATDRHGAHGGLWCQCPASGLHHDWWPRRLTVPANDVVSSKRQATSDGRLSPAVMFRVRAISVSILCLFVSICAPTYLKFTFVINTHLFSIKWIDFKDFCFKKAKHASLNL